MANKLIVRVSLNPRNIFEARIIDYLAGQENMAGAMKQLAYERLMIDQLQVGRTAQSIPQEKPLRKTRSLESKIHSQPVSATPTPEIPTTPPEASQPAAVADSAAVVIPTPNFAPENDAERAMDKKLDNIIGSFL